MPVIFTKGNYPYSTLVEDSFGCLHLFEGMQIPSNHPTLSKVLNKEADRFFQSQDDIEVIKSYLPEDERMHLSLGYSIQTKNIPDDYFESY
jgi:hypothetical protein